MKKILKNIKSSQAVMGAIVMIIILTISVTTSVIVPQHFTVSADTNQLNFETQAHTDFSYYKDITIESTYIESTLTDFPLLIHDSTGDLLGKVQSDGSDIAFYNATNETQYYHEIEYYNSTNGELWAWVNISSIASDSDTRLYMYYGHSGGEYDVGYQPRNVWDGHYMAVYHLNDDNTDTSILDSTWQNNATKNQSAAPGQSFTEAAIAISQKFTPATGDVINCTNVFNGANAIQDMTFSFWTKTLSSGIWQCYFMDRPDDGDQLSMMQETDDDMRYTGERGSDDKEMYGSDYTQHGWIMYTYTTTKGGPMRGIVNTTQDIADTANNADFVPSGQSFYIGSFIGAGFPVATRTIDGYIDEFRISNVTRSWAYTNASFHSQNETTGFLTLGSEVQSDNSAYSLKGLPSNRITWQGDAGTDVWCNATGDYNETIEVNMSINSSDNVTDLMVFVGDLNDTNQWINASNITLYASSDNSSYGYIGTFTDGGSNLSINTSTWEVGTMGASPFTLGGITNTNTSIYCRFNLTIPSGISTDTFWSTSATAFKIYIVRKT